MFVLLLLKEKSGFLPLFRVSVIVKLKGKGIVATINGVTTGTHKYVRVGLVTMNENGCIPTYSIII